MNKLKGVLLLLGLVVTTPSLAQLQVTPVSKEIVIAQSAINRDATLDSLAAGAIDSTGILSVAKFNRIELWFRLTTCIGFNRNARIAVQVRKHFNNLSDSLNTYVVCPTTGNFGGNWVVDTLTYNAAALGSTTAPGSCEFTVGSPGSGSSAFAPRFIVITLQNVLGSTFVAKSLSIKIRNIVSTAVRVNMHVIGYLGAP